MFGGARRPLDLELAGAPVVATLTRQHDGAAVLGVGGEHWPFSARALGDGRHDVQLGERRLLLHVYRHGERIAVFAPEASALVHEIDRLAHAGDAAAEGRLSAPMPGKVVSLLVAVGAAVRKGQAVAVMEAMKMEHTLHAPRDGTVAQLMCGVGDQLPEGAELMSLEGAA